jgi:MFS transporter, ACS family, glucarate transporter
MNPAAPPTRARFIVLAFLCTMAAILYLDRACMSAAVDPIEHEFGITKQWKMSIAMVAFTLAYGAFEIPTGRLGDRFGARRTLARVVAGWSIFTMLTAACWGLGSLIAVRFLFGAAEAGAFPNAARIVARWFPKTERGRVQGLMLTCALLGSSISPGLASLLIGWIDWRGMFVVFGSVGIIWAIIFTHWFRDDPAEHSGVNEAERATIGTGGPPPEHRPIPWREVFGNRSIWLLAGIIVCSSFVSYVYLSWYPKYLQSAREVGRLGAGVLASLALAGGAVGTLGGGFIVDHLTRKRAHPARARQRICSAAMASAGVILAVAMQVDSPWLSASLTSLFLLAMMSFQSTWWSTAIEVSGGHVGSLFGLMNGLGAIGAVSSQLFFGVFADWRAEQGYVGRDQWDPAFWACVAMLFVASLMWLGVDSRKKIGDGDHSPASAIGGKG